MVADGYQTTNPGPTQDCLCVGLEDGPEFIPLLAIDSPAIGDGQVDDLLDIPDSLQLCGFAHLLTVDAIQPAWLSSPVKNGLSTVQATGSPHCSE